MNLISKKRGRIIVSRKGFFTVDSENELCVCKACTRLRLEKKEPLCGDIVAYNDNGDGTGFITDLEPRKNFFPRPGVANADMLVIVIASANPQPDLFYVDKMTCIGVKAAAEIIIVVNKTDLKNADEYVGIYKKCGFRTFKTRSDTGDGIEELKNCLSGKIAVFAGPSGVGKSSLLNAMYPEYNAVTGTLSQKIMRGKNTTRHIELFKTSSGGYIADTPGFTSIDFEKFDLLAFSELKGSFPEMQEYMTDCRFRNCGHTKESGCAVISAVECGNIPKSRHESYVRLFELLKNKTLY
ncbi:MAG: ribosome small subunit-dependent GTPase A [Eubacteriales bacterium]|nr:ribosome small subunit-dependent GTPase A [Eubacteriales bacterium]